MEKTINKKDRMANMKKIYKILIILILSNILQCKSCDTFYLPEFKCYVVSDCFVKFQEGEPQDKLYHEIVPRFSLTLEDGVAGVELSRIEWEHFFLKKGDRILNIDNCGDPSSWVERLLKSNLHKRKDKHLYYPKIDYLFSASTFETLKEKIKKIRIIRNGKEETLILEEEYKKFNIELSKYESIKKDKRDQLVELIKKKCYKNAWNSAFNQYTKDFKYSRNKEYIEKVATNNINELKALPDLPPPLDLTPDEMKQYSNEIERRDEKIRKKYPRKEWLPRREEEIKKINKYWRKRKGMIK